jgi:hypothetical protein
VTTGHTEFERNFAGIDETGQPEVAASEPLLFLAAALAELQFELSRWARVPRVCASVASTTGFLCASVRLRSGLLEDISEGESLQVILRGVDMVAIGMATALTCAAIQRASNRRAKAMLSAADALVDAVLPADVADVSERSPNLPPNSAA